MRVSLLKDAGLKGRGENMALKKWTKPGSVTKWAKRRGSFAKWASSSWNMKKGPVAKWATKKSK